MLSDVDGCKARQQLNTWVLEVETLTAGTALIYPGNLKKFARCKMDDVTMWPDKAPPTDDVGILVSHICFCLSFRHMHT